MSKIFKTTSRRIAWVTLVLVIGLGLLRAANEDARAQFPRGLPSLPSIPNIGGSGSHRGNQDDLRNLADLGKKAGEIGDLDNPQRQQDLGQSIALVISNQYPVSKNRDLNEYVNLVGLTVASVCPRPELNFTFGVLETPEVGAYSAPGGCIFVTRGALNLMQDESELAGVLAHEVAHVVLNHGIEAVKSAKAKELADTFVEKYGRNYAAYSEYTQAGTDFLLNKSYSQNQERDADSKAVTYLIRAKYDPRGFARFLQRLEQQQSNAPTNLAKQMFSTHPGTHERINNVTRQINQSKVSGGATLKGRFEANLKPNG
jgi:predicted Zn-dependent protease